MTKHLSDIEVRGSVTSTQTVEGQGGVITRTVAGTPVDTVSDGMITIDTTNNKLYYRSGGSWRESGSASSVATLTDVELTTLTAGQALVYNGTKWVNQTVSGGGAGSVYLATIGDGTTSLFTITHGLGTRDVVVVVRNALSPYEVIQVTWNATTTTSVTLDFGMAPATNSVRVAIYASVTGNNVAMPLDGLTDVVVTAPEEFQSLVYDGTNWVNRHASTVTYVRNAETTTLTTGTVVYLFGATGDHATVKRADNDADSTSSKTVGLVAANIPASENGPVVTRGYVDGINLTAYSPGDVLWLGENGAFTSTKPSAPEHLVFIGVVVRNTSNGIVYVATQNGYELDELHDVSISSPSSAQVLKHNGTLWNNDYLYLDDLYNVNASAPSDGQFLKYDDALLAWVPADVPTINTLDDVGDVLLSTPLGSYDVLQWNGMDWVNSQSLTINSIFFRGSLNVSVPTTIDDYGVSTYPWTMIPTGYAGPGVSTNLIDTPGSQLVISGEYVYFHPNVSRNSALPTGLLNVGSSYPGYYLTDWWYPNGTVTSYTTRTGGINTTHVGAMSIGLTYRNSMTQTMDNSNFYIAFTGGVDSENGNVTVNVPANITIDNPNGALVVTGNLTVSGTTTTVNTTNLQVKDNIITLNYGVTGSPSLNAGMEVIRGSSATVALRWNESTDLWEATENGTTYKNIAYTANKLSSFAATSSLELASVISDETGTGSLVFGTSPTISTSLVAGTSSFDLLNTTATTINFAGAATSLAIGQSTTSSVVYGRIGFGQQASTNTGVRFRKPMSSPSSFAIYADPTFQVGVTSAEVFRSHPETDTSLSLVNLYHYATPGITNLGAGSSVQTQVGFMVYSNFTQAGTNIGFWGDIASGSNRWNLYMQGTADNYIRGRLGVGTSSVSGAAMTLLNNTASEKVLIVRSASAQSATVIEQQNNSGSTVIYTSNDGSIFSYGTVTASVLSGYTATRGDILQSNTDLVLRYNSSGTPSSNANIQVLRGTSATVSIRWNEITDKWQFTNDGTTYKDLGSGGVTVSDTAPSSPAVGDMWYESDTGALYAYYDSFWIEIGGSAAYNEIVGSIQAKGDLLAGSGSQAITRLGVGANGRRLAADSTTATGLAWVDDSVNTVVNAKGDILAGTANDAVGRTPVGTNGQVLVADSTTTTGIAWAEYPTQFRNKIINGMFSINQRAASSYTGTSALGRFMDNWMGYASSGTVTFSPSTTVVPDGFETSIAVNVVSGGAYSSGAGNFCLLGTKVEGYNMAPFAWGTSAAKSATLSFWARSSIAGTYTVSFQNDGFQNMVYVATYSITTPNVWQRIVITVPGPTTGTWNGLTNTSFNSAALWLAWSFGVDTNFETANVNTWQSLNRYGTSSGVDIANTTGATFYMTGVQLEVGSQATSFEYRDFATELAMCQRYYEKTYDYSVVPGSSSQVGTQFVGTVSDTYSNALVYVNFKTRKRVAPSLDVWSESGTANNWIYQRSGTGETNSSYNWTSTWNGETGGLVFFGVGASFVPVSIRGHWVARAEL